ncbi:MAG TPA: hypothetical protein VFB54_17685 [Burkholderiales bacterium]|nr:hypothetical protein [Burkholderiales bacterium]
MPLPELPAPPPIDRSCAGRLRIAVPMLGSLLKLPPGQAVVSARITDLGDIELLIEGAGLPEREANGSAPLTNLILHRECRPGDVAKGGMQWRITMNWENSPEQQWIWSDWSYSR